MSVKNGSTAVGFTLPNIEGNLVSLDDLLSEGQNVLIVFLRHLG